MSTPPWFTLTFWVVSLLGSSFYGWKAFEVFGVKTEKKNWGWWTHQVWFNFIGALIGWLAIWILMQDAWPCFTTTCRANLTWSNGVLLSVAFVGITGHWPFALSGILQAINELALKAMGIKPPLE